MNRKIFTKKAFTLIEMLIVVSIIAILIAAGSVAYSTVQKKGRDAKRKQDMDAVQKALEQVRAICSSYPKTGEIYTGSGILCNTTVIMNPVPLDPKTGAQFTYTSDGTTYTLCLPNSPLPFEAETTANYCLKNLQ